MIEAICTIKSTHSQLLCEILQKLQDCSLQLYSKRDSNTEVFLQTFRMALLQAPPCDCFYTTKMYHRGVLFSLEKTTTIPHCLKYRSFTYFSGVEILWKSTVRKVICLKLCGKCAFLQNFYTGKLGEIKVFYTVRDKIFRTK